MMTKSQWRSVVRTFWTIVVIAVVAGFFAVLNTVQDNSERRAREDVCEIVTEYNLDSPNC